MILSVLYKSQRIMNSNPVGDSASGVNKYIYNDVYDVLNDAYHIIEQVTSLNLVNYKHDSLLPNLVNCFIPHNPNLSGM